MLTTAQLDEAAFRVDTLSALRATMLGRDECSAAVILPTLTDLPNQIQFASTFAGILSSWETQAAIRWSCAFASSRASGREAETNWVQAAWASGEFSAHEGQ